ncbi:MAG: hypothetical protein WCP32_10260 [Bacteroidota bacterium]
MKTKAPEKTALTESFRDWYFSLPARDQKDIRNRIFAACEINYVKFGNWLSGNSTPSKLEQKEINKIAQYNIFL